MLCRTKCKCNCNFGAIVFLFFEYQQSEFWRNGRAMRLALVVCVGHAAMAAAETMRVARGATTRRTTMRAAPRTAAVFRAPRRQHSKVNTPPPTAPGSVYRTRELPCLFSIGRHCELTDRPAASERRRAQTGPSPCWCRHRRRRRRPRRQRAP